MILKTILLLFLLLNFLQSQSTCDPSCLTCNGPLSNNCISCVSSLKLMTNRCKTDEDSIDFLKEFTSQSRIKSYLTLFWTFNNDKTITMAIRWSTGGYMSIGFGDSMKNVDMIVAEKRNGVISLKDTWSTSEDDPRDDTRQGGTYDLQILGYSTNDGFGNSIVKFNRKLNTNDERDFVIIQQKTIMTYAYSSDNTLEYHGNNYGIFNLPLIEGNIADSEILDKEPDYIEAHSIGLLITWSFFIELPIFVIRYCKHWKYYLDIHGFMFLISDFFTIIIVFIVLGKNADALEITLKGDDIIMAHFITGIIVVSCIVFQHILGVVMKIIITSTKKSILIEKINTLKDIHKYLGYFIYLLSKACVLIGTLINKDRSYFVGFLVYYCVLIFARTIWEFFYKFSYGKKQKPIQSSKVGEQNQIFLGLIEDINAFDKSKHQLLKKHPNLKWCLLNQSIINLNDFNHPGGKFIIDEILGREIGRFIYGGYPLESTKMAFYNHSEQAKSIILERFIKDIEYGDSNILKFRGSPDKNDWKLIDKTHLAPNISKFDFSNSQISIKNYVKGVNWIGRHFSICVSSKPNEKTRLYTTIISYTQENLIFRNNLIKFYDEILQNNSIGNLTLNPPKLISDTLPFIIKKYSFPNTFSSFLHDSDEKIFKIEGPLGLGLELNKSNDGTHVIFCGGTGILPFIDLLDYLLKKSIFHVLNQKFDTKTAMIMNPFNEDYINTFGKNFKVQLFCSFSDETEFKYVEFIKNLYEINKANKLNLFDMVIRIKDNKIFEDNIPTTNEFFNEGFMKKNLDLNKISKIYVCGNPTMNRTIPEILQKIQIEKEKIILV